MRSWWMHTNGSFVRDGFRGETGRMQISGLRLRTCNAPLSLQRPRIFSQPKVHVTQSQEFISIETVSQKRKFIMLRVLPQHAKSLKLYLYWSRKQEVCVHCVHVGLVIYSSLE